MEPPISVDDMRNMNIHEIARRVQEVIQHRLDSDADYPASGLLEPSENPV